MTESDLDSDDEYLVDLETPAEETPPIRTDCCNCLSELEDVIYVECAECEAVICLPCFRMGAEMGDHKRGHAYRIVDGLSKHRFKGQWSHTDEVQLIDAAHTAKLGNWNVLTEGETESEKKKSREEISEYYDKQFIRGAVGQFALNEGFWMKDRHKYKKMGTLKRLLDDEKHTNPLIHNLYLAAMRWKKCTKWKPSDPKLEENIRQAAHEYANYEFDIEGRELLGCLRDDYFFGGDLILPEPLLVNPEFERQERKEEAIRRRRERAEVDDMLEEDRIWRAERDNALKKRNMLATESSSSSSTSSEGAESNDCNGQSTSNNISSRRSSRGNQLEAEEIKKFTHPPTAPSVSPTPLKIILKKIGKGDGRTEGYIVAQTTLALDDSPFRARTNGRRHMSQASLDSPEDSDEETPRQLNGHHKTNGINGCAHTNNGYFTDDKEDSIQEFETEGGEDTRDSAFETPPTSQRDNDSDSIYATPERGNDEEMDMDDTLQKDPAEETIEERTFEKQISEEPEEEEEEDFRPAKLKKTSGNVIRTRKQRRKKKVVKSKKLRRLEAFHKRETTKSRKREKEFEQYADLITMDDVVLFRKSSPYLALFRNGENQRPDRPKYRHDDLVMLTHNPERNEFEVESFADAETMISELQLGPVTGLHPMTEVEQETKIARIYRYKRALQIRSARKTAITEHDKITEFIDFMKAMTLERRKCSEVLKERTKEEKLMARSQQTLTREEFGNFQSRWEKFIDLKEKIQKLQELQRNGVTTLKGVDLVPSRKKREKKKNSEALKKADARFKALQRLHIKMYAPEE